MHIHLYIYIYTPYSTLSLYFRASAFMIYQDRCVVLRRHLRQDFGQSRSPNWDHGIPGEEILQQFIGGFVPLW